ncbi:hypothetical protein FKW77_001482 [Venturia effusa]|uniref:Uncharacterized protein n=1 Tax=Venturia effusa TaxID=50376 RepID=A0A517L6N3_9PEZI|nr:hypothetical protein FKW77_001482 [Venturia effusa]
MMQTSEAAPASNLSSPVADGSTYGTPGAKSHSAASSEPSPAMGKQNEKDPQMVVSAGKSIKNMLVDLMGVLEPQAKSKIFIQGDVTLRIEGREAYTISLFNEDGIEPSNLKVQIGHAKAPSNPPTEQSNGASNRKRAQEALSLSEETDASQKRRRVESMEDNQDQPGDTVQEEKDATATAPAEDHADSNASIMTKLHSVSAQIKWVEECRRIADEAHDGREERWRSSSATFHDETRKARERHEAWVVQEMAWQRNMLIGLSNDMKGLHSIGHSMKWETPASMQQVPPPGPPLPMGPAQSGQPHPFVPYNSKPAKNAGGAAGKASTAGTNIRPK